MLPVACSDAVEDQEEGEGAQGGYCERDQAGTGGLRFCLRLHFREHEESEIQGVQGATQIHRQFLRGDAGLLCTNLAKEEVQR
ncbi:hypothetical protein BHE74_00035337 [Ensete ventricosum]|nr:hypothetical protein GW17_00043960 [Ensete ventricosum]RWW57842.1 hypothetical protein BHE74_00035337 [Ensete ventricosum]RZS12064.1 hypothetical protein BHM03_00043449 [Ensete ventricosum]